MKAGEVLQRWDGALTEIADLGINIYAFDCIDDLYDMLWEKVHDQEHWSEDGYVELDSESDCVLCEEEVELGLRP